MALELGASVGKEHGGTDNSGASAPAVRGGGRCLLGLLSSWSRCRRHLPGWGWSVGIRESVALAGCSSTVRATTAEPRPPNAPGRSVPTRQTLRFGRTGLRQALDPSRVVRVTTLFAQIHVIHGQSDWTIQRVPTPREDSTMTDHVRSNLVACSVLAAGLVFLPAAAVAQSSRTPPQAPANLQSLLDGQANVTLNWTDQSNNELGFRIIREQQLGASWGDSQGFTVPANTTTYQDSPSPGVYRYRVRAYNQRGNSSYTPRVQITVTAASQVPVAPTGLVVQDGGGGNAHLTWTDVSTNETGFEIERQPAFSVGLQQVGANVVAYDDPTGGGKLAYRVRSVNPSGSSSFTPWIRVSVQAPSGGSGVSQIATLSPGSGFTGPTAQPPAAQTGLLKRPPPVSAPGGLTEGGFPRVVATAPPAATPPPPAPRAPSAGPTRNATSSWQSGTFVENGTAAEKPAGAPASGGGVGEFFSGLFGGGAPASPPPAAKSSDGPAWSTSVRSPSSHKGTEKHAQKSAPVVTSSAPSAADASGKYRLQIAAVRSRKEADAVAARIRKEHGRVIGARKLEVDETVFGNMGTFYRVRLGPFAAAGESKAVCDQLRTKGFDCLVVTQ